MAFLLLALAAMAQPALRPAGALMPARATVRIVAGARVHLGPSAKARMIKASVHIEDGQRRPAYLIEFE
ncbi:MAG: hypothetical protein V4696_07335 [Pseudomonadota bacterium]